jgi:hypothetical protein
MSKGLGLYGIIVPRNRATGQWGNGAMEQRGNVRRNEQEELMRTQVHEHRVIRWLVSVNSSQADLAVTLPVSPRSLLIRPMPNLPTSPPTHCTLNTVQTRATAYYLPSGCSCNSWAASLCIRTQSTNTCVLNCILKTDMILSSFPLVPNRTR